jgi:hypothetical protein
LEEKKTLGVEECSSTLPKLRNTHRVHGAKNPKEDYDLNTGGMVSTVIGNPLAKNTNGLTCSLR